MTPLIFTRNSTYFDTSLLVRPEGGCDIRELNAVKYVFNTSATLELSTSASGSYVGYDIVIEKSIANNYFSGTNIRNGTFVIKTIARINKITSHKCKSKSIKTHITFRHYIVINKFFN